MGEVCATFFLICCSFSESFFDLRNGLLSTGFRDAKSRSEESRFPQKRVSTCWNFLWAKNKCSCTHETVAYNWWAWAYVDEKFIGLHWGNFIPFQLSTILPAIFIGKFFYRLTFFIRQVRDQTIFPIFKYISYFTWRNFDLGLWYENPLQ